jgi:REP element-mobilizing transposase RayT
MSRSTRQYVSGGVFHITARTQGKCPWFTRRLRGVIVEIIVKGVALSDAKLLAYAVMPNHFHMVVVQGSMTLGTVMQPIMRRIALLIQRSRKSSGHVFERAYRSFSCADPDYVRAAIVYTHLNPWRAGLCKDPCDYKWTSHETYLGKTASYLYSTQVATDLGLRLFAHNGEMNPTMLRGNYLAAVQHRVLLEQAKAGAAVNVSITGCSHTQGDQYFLTEMRRACRPADPPWRPDLRDAAQSALRVWSRDIALYDLRGTWLPHQLVAVRRNVIAWLLGRGYRGCDIAHFFGISPATVSKVSAAVRAAQTSRMFV